VSGSSNTKVMNANSPSVSVDYSGQYTT
jgi:hypothetical protein